MYYDDDNNDDNTLLGRLTELNRALSQMMRNTSERNIVEKLHTYQLAIKKTLKIMTKKQLNTISCLLYTSPSPRDMRRSRMPSSA